MNHCIDCKFFQLNEMRFPNRRDLQTVCGECSKAPLEDLITGYKKISEAYKVRERSDMCGIEGRWFEKFER